MASPATIAEDVPAAIAATLCCWVVTHAYFTGHLLRGTTPCRNSNKRPYHRLLVLMLNHNTRSPGPHNRWLDLRAGTARMASAELLCKFCRRRRAGAKEIKQMLMARAAACANFMSCGHCHGLHLLLVTLLQVYHPNTRQKINCCTHLLHLLACCRLVLLLQLACAHAVIRAPPSHLQGHK